MYVFVCVCVCVCVCVSQPAHISHELVVSVFNNLEQVRNIIFCTMRLGDNCDYSRGIWRRDKLWDYCHAWNQAFLHVKFTACRSDLISWSLTLAKPAFYLHWDSSIGKSGSYPDHVQHTRTSRIVLPTLSCFCLSCSAVGRRWWMQLFMQIMIPWKCCSSTVQTQSFKTRWAELTDGCSIYANGLCDGLHVPGLQEFGFSSWSIKEC